MSRKVIVVGDITTGGGRVITGSAETDIDGNPVSRINDSASCPKHKGVFKIVSGDVTFIVDGQPVARHGDYLACGCRLISIRQFRVFLDTGISDNPIADAALFNAAGSAAKADDALFDQRFLLTDSLTGVPLARQPYRMSFQGSITESCTDDDGLTDPLPTGAVASEVTCEILGLGEIADG